MLRDIFGYNTNILRLTHPDISDADSFHAGNQGYLITNTKMETPVS
jgi:hypothetical protein